MDFEARITKTISDSARECRYTPHIFIEMRARYGTVEAIKMLLRKPIAASGFVRLWEKDRLDLTVESIILEPEWADLFTPEERQIAKRRLDEFKEKKPSIWGLAMAPAQQ